MNATLALVLSLIFLMQVGSRPDPSFSGAGSIRGVVMDAETGRPIEGANVYLANTTQGTTTNARGRYSITGVRPGSYLIAVSRVDYAGTAVPIALHPDSVIEVNMVLRPRLISTEEVSVEAERLEDWKSVLREFKGELLGSGELAERCTVINPEVLRFSRDDSTKAIRVTTVRPLTIRNAALGYTLEVDIHSFTWDVAARSTFYQLYTRFAPMPPRDSVQEREWLGNRRKVYLGSRMHFLRALAAGALEEEGFRMYTGMEAALFEGRGSPVGAVLDTIAPVVAPGVRMFLLGESVRVEYRGPESRGSNIFRLSNVPARVEISGQISDSTAILVHPSSPWAQERLGRLLPLDYGW